MNAPNSPRRVGVEIFYWMEEWTDDQASYFARARDAGFDGVEISFVAGEETSLDRIAKEAESQQLEVVASTGLTPDLDITSEDPSTRRAGIDYLVWALEAAASLRSPILGGVTYAPWFHFPEDSDLQDHRNRGADSLAQVAPVAQELGVDLCLEVLNRFETFMFNTVEEALAFLDKVDHPSLKIELDTFHMNMEEDDLPGAVLAAGSRLGHFQCAANNRRPPQHGHIDWAPIKAALDQVGYEGWLVFETFPNPTVATGRTTHAWRGLVDDLDAEAKEAADFIRGNLA